MEIIWVTNVTKLATKIEGMSKHCQNERKLKHIHCKKRNSLNFFAEPIGKGRINNVKSVAK